MNLKATVENLKNKAANLFKEKEERILTKEILFENVINYSRAKRVAEDLLGPTGKVVVTYEGTGERTVTSCTLLLDGEVAGEGKTIPDAFVDATKDLTLREVQELAGPALVSLEVARAGNEALQTSLQMQRLMMQPRPRPATDRRSRHRARRTKMRRLARQQEA